MKVYIQCNRRQHLAAKVSEYTFKKFNLDTEIILIEECDFFKKLKNQKYLRNGKKTVYKDDLQSFTLLRFYIPSIHQGKEDFLIVDPDVFAIRNPISIKHNFNNENNICCTYYKHNPRTEVMYFNDINSSWNFEKILFDLLNFNLDYKDLFNLKFKNQNLNLNQIEHKYNQHDQILQDTVLLHTTKRISQPWKLDLKIDFERNTSLKNLLINNLKKFFGLKYNEEITTDKYIMHENKDVFEYLLKIFSEAISSNVINEDEITNSILNKYLSKKFIDQVKGYDN